MEDKRKQKKALPFSKWGITRERENFIENFSLLVGSGISINEALKAIQEERNSKRMQQMIGTIEDDIQSGFTLSSSLERRGIFPINTVSMIRIGEETGQLAENLRVIAQQQIKDRAFKAKIKSAMMYPLFVLGLALFIGIGLAWFILPKLSNVFNQLDLELPAMTKALIWFGTFLGKNGWWFIPLGVMVILLILYFIFFFPKTKFIGQKLLFVTPGIRKLIIEVERARFGFQLGTLLNAGIGIPKALQSAKEAATFPQYKKLYQRFEESVVEGNSFKKTFQKYPQSKKLLSTAVEQLIGAAEQSGNLAETFLSISKNYEEKTEITSKNLSVILEPFLLVVVWIGVVMIALAVILPLYNLIGGL